MPKKAKALRVERPERAKSAGQMAVGTSRRVKKELARRLTPKSAKKATVSAAERLLSSEVVYQGSLFRVLHDKLIEPGGKPSERDVIRHHGSVVILAIDDRKSKKDPLIVLERQYRHAALRYMWELPAGKLDPGEEPLAGAQRELAEETGFQAGKWRPLVEYFGSPGFLGESMKVFLAERLVPGEAHPEEDEEIELRMVRLSDLLKMIEKGLIVDGKTLTSVLLYARLISRKRKK
jgi:ADP-ribose pyrophosphatase